MSHTPETPMTPVPADEKTLEQLLAEERAAQRRETRRLRTQARQMFAAIDGWMGMETPQDWQRACRRAAKNYRSGRFLMERFGAERLLEPELLTTLWGLRQALVRELGAASAAEAMLVDLAVLNYATALRLNAMVGNAALTIEHQFFGEEPPAVRFRERHGSAVAERLSVEHAIDALRLHLMPLFDRANRGLIRNLRALHDLRQPVPTPVSIGQAGQVNVGGQQVNQHLAGQARNLHAPGGPDARPPAHRR
jgi:hypothetical protein